MNGKLNDIITLMQAASLSGNAVKRKRTSVGDMGRQPTKQKESCMPIQSVEREATSVTRSIVSAVSTRPLGSTGPPGPKGSTGPRGLPGPLGSTGTVS